MADIRSPNIDFTVDTPANRLNMVTSEPWSDLHPMAPINEIGYNYFVTPVLGSSGGGGGGPVTTSVPITG